MKSKYSKKKLVGVLLHGHVQPISFTRVFDSMVVLAISYAVHAESIIQFLNICVPFLHAILVNN